MMGDDMPERIWARPEGEYGVGFDAVKLATWSAEREYDDDAQYVHIDAYNAAIASARAQALEEAARKADECHARYMKSKGRDPAEYMSSFSMLATAIRALSTRPDTITPLIAAAKAVVENPRIRSVIITLDGSDELDRLAAAIAAHEGKRDE